MMNLRRSCFLVLLFGTGFGASSAHGQVQQVLAAAGAELQSGGVGIAFTIGQLVIETRSQSEFILTQGFHQPPDDFSTEVMSTMEPAVNITAFPNPASEQVTIVTEGFTGSLALHVVDATGRLVAAQDNVPAKHTLDVTGLSRGCYSILMFSDDHLIATLKLSIAR